MPLDVESKHDIFRRLNFEEKEGYWCGAERALYIGGTVYAVSGMPFVVSFRMSTGEELYRVSMEDYFAGLYRERRGIEALSAEPGGGIGLALCRMITEKHGGTLILESREGEGTDVRVLLPLTPPGMMDLMSAGTEYSNGGMPAVLTELSELLDAEAYLKLRSD